MQKWKKSILFTSLFVVLCVLASFGGYKGSRLLADSITVKAEQNAEKAGLFKPKEADSPFKDDVEGTAFGKSRPLKLIYIVDYETGKIEKLILEQLDTIGMTASFIYFETEILYTMTPALYKKLVTGNVLLPQTVTFKELYAYYGNESVFDAGRLIVDELLGVEIDYYIVMSTEKVPGEFMRERITSLGLKDLYEGKIPEKTDINEYEMEYYAGLCEYIADRDINIYEAPVIRRNESCFADVNGIWEILGTLIY